jgi:hypothetical protein
VGEHQAATAMAATATTSTTFEALPTQPVIASQLSPSAQPAPIRTVFQIAEPSVVSAVKRATPMRIVPAGIETTERAPGTRRAPSTTQSPQRANQVSARSICCGPTRRRRPHRSIAGRPPQRPIA